MFICEKCGKRSAPNEKSFQLVVETRKARYPIRDYQVHEKGAGKVWRTDPGGIGTEIAKEQQVCSACFGRAHEQNPME